MYIDMLDCIFHMDKNVSRQVGLYIPYGQFLVLIEKKTLWEKEKMLVSSIFSCSHRVFQSPLP